MAGEPLRESGDLGANAGWTVALLVAGMAAGADSIDDMVMEVCGDATEGGGLGYFEARGVNVMLAAVPGACRHRSSGGLERLGAVWQAGARRLVGSAADRACGDTGASHGQATTHKEGGYQMVCVRGRSLAGGD